MNPVIDLLRVHRSIRKFTAQAIEPAVFEQVLLAGQSAATSSFVQATTVIRIRDPQTRARLAHLAGDQAYVVTAAEFLVFCADLKRAENCCGLHGKPFAGDFTEHFIIATVDVALMAQNVAVAAESVGLGICYIGGIRNNPGPVSELLALPRGVYPVFGMCLGYPDQNPEPKPRLPLGVILKDERYDDTGDAEAIANYDAEIQAYYRSRTGGGHGTPWSAQVANLLAEKCRPHMRAFLADQGFTFR